MRQFLDFLKQVDFGDVAGLIGLLMFGFAFTFWF
jgi:hypothetical protein